MSIGKSPSGIITRDFIALDTETYQGRAFILSNKTRIWEINSFDDFIKAVVPLGRKFVFYNLDYDISGLCKHLSHETTAHIYLDRSVKVGSDWLRYIPGKVFSLSHAGKKYEFFDLYPFFQCSLNHASKKFLGIEKFDLPKDLIGKLSPKVYKENKALIDSYAIRDSELLQQLVDIFSASLFNTGLRTRSLYSPGYLAKRYLRQNKITIPPIPKEHTRIIESTYFGGRIESAKRGQFDAVSIYDIKSAYPWAMRDMPNFDSAHYEMSDEIFSEYYLCQCDIDSLEDAASLLAYTNKGLNIYPNANFKRRWITCFEHKALGSPKYYKALNILPTPGFPYRDIIDTLYAARHQSGMEGLIYKLILNSLYGITAERKRCYYVTLLPDVVRRLRYEHSRENFNTLVNVSDCPEAWHYWDKACQCNWCRMLRHMARRTIAAPKTQMVEYNDKFWTIGFKDGRFKNLLLASFITAKVRARLWQTIRDCGDHYIAAFTDSLISTGGGPEICDGLGAWEKKYQGPLTLVGCGIYETEDETKFRGFHLKREGESEEERKLDRPLRRMLENSKGTKIAVSQLDRLSFGNFVRSGYQSYTDFNVLTPYEKVLDINNDKKREWARPFLSGTDAVSGMIDSKPLRVGSL